MTRAIAVFAIFVNGVANLPAADNELTPQEKGEGYRLLFDGKSPRGCLAIGKTSLSGFISVAEFVKELLFQTNLSS